MREDGCSSGNIKLEVRLCPRPEGLLSFEWETAQGKKDHCFVPGVIKLTLIDSFRYIDSGQGNNATNRGNPNDLYVRLKRDCFGLMAAFNIKEPALCHSGKYAYLLLIIRMEMLDRLKFLWWKVLM